MVLLLGGFIVNEHFPYVEREEETKQVVAWRADAMRPSKERS